LAATGGTLAPGRGKPSALWLWTSADARAALATGNLGIIMKAWRTITGTGQRALAEALGYDSTYISMIENNRRDIVDVDSRRRFAHHLSIPPHVLGVTDRDDADHVAMLQFGYSTLRLAALARRSGHGTAAVNELWPLVARLEARGEQGMLDHDLLTLLARARAELGVSLGYVLPEERLASAARWTGKALQVAQHLDEPDLRSYALRVHGNELRKAGHPAAAHLHLTHAAAITSGAGRAEVLLQLARVTFDPDILDALIIQLRQLADQDLDGSADGLLNPTAIRETELRGLLATGRAGQALQLLETFAASGWAPPQWRIIERITIAEVLIACGDTTAAAFELTAAVADATVHRLPHQLQRAQRAAQTRLPDIAEHAARGLQTLTAPP
jgi:transcriptional regulator with XRE-family HTH domain/predicted negative regulator of RcsB-dependent stress response